MRREPWDLYRGTRKLDQSYVRELFEYVDDELYWKHRPVSHFKDYQSWKRWFYRFAESRAGTLPNYERKKKHRRVTIDGVAYYLSRVIWMYHHGEWPEYCWHIDGNRQNCAIENLESLTFAENLARVEQTSRSYALRRWATGKWAL